MRRDQFNSRRFLVQVLLGVNVIIWGAGLAWADETSKATESKSAEYASESFESGGATIRAWRFDPKAVGKKPAVLLLYGADGLASAEKMYTGAAKRLTGKGFVVFLVHYLDATQEEDVEKVSNLVKRGLVGKVKEDEERRVRRHFRAWRDCVSDAVGYVRKRPRVDGERVGIVGVSLGGFVGLSCAAREELEVAAVVSCFGGLPRERREAVKWLPPDTRGSRRQGRGRSGRRGPRAARIGGSAKVAHRSRNLSKGRPRVPDSGEQI